MSPGPRPSSCTNPSCRRIAGGSAGQRRLWFVLGGCNQRPDSIKTVKADDSLDGGLRRIFAQPSGHACGNEPLDLSPE